jgi:hypothetical protein
VQTQRAFFRNRVAHTEHNRRPWHFCCARPD